MKNRFGIVLFVIILAFPVLLFGQLKQNTKTNFSKALSTPTVQNIVSLIGLDPNKFSMSHSYSLSFSAMGGQGYNQSLYLNTMQYQLSGPLSFHLQLGVQHHPFGNQIGDNQLQNSAFVSSAGMEYKPTDNVKLQLQFSQRPSSYYNMNRAFMDPISRNRDFFDAPSKSDEGGDSN